MASILRAMASFRFSSVFSLPTLTVGCAAASSSSTGPIILQGAAPVGPEIHHDGQGALQNLGVKILFGDLDRHSCISFYNKHKLKFLRPHTVEASTARMSRLECPMRIFVPARRGAPGVQLGAVTAYILRRQRKDDLPLLAGLQVDLRKPAQRLGHPPARHRRARGIGHIELHDLGSAHRAAVFHRHPRGHGAAWRQRVGVQRRAAVDVARVAQPVAERPAHRHFAGVVPAVAHVDALAVVGGHAVTREIQIAGRVLQPQGPGLGQTPAGVGVAPQQGVRGLAQTPRPPDTYTNRRYIVRPGALHRAGRCAAPRRCSSARRPRGRSGCSGIRAGACAAGPRRPARRIRADRQR